MRLVFIVFSELRRSCDIVRLTFEWRHKGHCWTQRLTQAILTCVAVGARIFDLLEVLDGKTQSTLREVTAVGFCRDRTLTA